MLIIIFRVILAKDMSFKNTDNFSLSKLLKIRQGFEDGYLLTPPSDEFTTNQERYFLRGEILMEVARFLSAGYFLSRNPLDKIAAVLPDYTWSKHLIPDNSVQRKTFLRKRISRSDYILLIAPRYQRLSLVTASRSPRVRAKALFWEMNPELKVSDSQNKTYACSWIAREIAKAGAEIGIFDGALKGDGIRVLTPEEIS